MKLLVLEKIVYYRNRRDEVPNQELARELAETENMEGIREIAENLWHKNKSVQSDCLKVLYEIGYINPDMISGYVHEFLKLLKSKTNRMVWGAMIGLATIAEKNPGEIWANINDVIVAVEHGTLITVVWGVKTLGRVASTDKKYSERIFPFLIEHLRNCITRDILLHAESILPAVDLENKKDFLAVLDLRKSELKPSQLARHKKLLRSLEAKQL
jgi:vesicle coat complex subunit